MSEVFVCDDCKRKAINGVYLPDEDKKICGECAEEMIEEKKRGHKN